MEESFFDRLDAIYGYLNGMQRRIAEHWRTHAARVAEQSAEETADQLGITADDLTQMAQIMGYLDYTQLQADLRESLLDGGTVPQRVSSALQMQMDQLCAQLENDRNNLEKTMQLLPPEAIGRSISMLQQANKIWILGLRTSFSLAYYSYLRLSRVREQVNLVHATGLEYPEELSEIGTGDVLLAYLFPRYSKMTANLILLARGQGAKVLLVTDERAESLDAYADLMLPCFTRGVGETVSLAAPMSVSTFFAEALAQRIPQMAAKQAERTQALLIRGFDLGMRE